MIQRNYLVSMAFGLLGGLIVVCGYALWGNNRPQTISERQNQGVARFANYSSAPANLNFTEASAVATPAVVHIKSSVSSRGRGNNNMGELFSPFRDFFGEGFRDFSPQASAGSGVIITEDGYIVTNNHVIDEADKVEVVLNDNRSYTAKVIGTDPSTDLALVKIEDSNLPYLKFADSDKVQIGEWVLAVGNPFNLTSTVTAGIVSAKARSIGILADKYRIESFIQTDAAVNPGNSGGALINTNGDLIGINTAIATRTGSFSGYSFAVPVNIVRKVVDDLMKFGEVQRGFLGVTIQDVNAQLAENKQLGVTRGVLVQTVNEQSAAQEAGIKSDDVILKVNDAKVSTGSELQEQIGRHRPGDIVYLTILRKGDEKVIPVTLKNKSGNTATVTKSNRTATEMLGADMEEITRKDKDEFRINHGVRITNLYPGKLREAGVPVGFIITHIDKTPVYSPKDVEYKLKNKQGAVLLEGINESGRKEAFAVMF